MGVTAVEARERLRVLLLATAEQLLREVYQAENMGEPSADMVGAVRQDAADANAAMGQLSDEEAVAIAGAADERIIDLFKSAIRPKILDAITPLRPS